MSATKFECAPYKHFEPDYHPQRPIIVGEEGLDSPDTVTLKYEEAVARANGDLRGESPPEGLLPMSQYGKPQPAPIHGYEPARDYQDATYPQFGAPVYPGQQPANAAQLSAAQLNQEAFAANSAVGQYMPVGGPSVVSCQPSSGMAGTKVMIKVSSQDDLLTMTSPPPYLYLGFGNHKVLAEDVKNGRDNGNGCMLTFVAEAPDLMVTACQGPGVPLLLVIEAPNGNEVSRTGAGQFLYHVAPLGGPAANHGDITRKGGSGSPEQQEQPSPRSGPAAQMGYDSNTNTAAAFDFNTAPAQQQPPPQQQQPAHNQYDNAFPPDNGNNMLTTYRASSFAENHYPRAIPPPLRPPMDGWQGAYGRTGSTSLSQHPTISSRPNLTPLPMPTPTTPTLVRTTSLQTSPGSSQSSGYPGWNTGGSSSYSSSNKAVLTIIGKLMTMTENWTQDEWSNRRRIVMFNKKQSGPTLTTTFRAVNVNERPPNSTCISCIWWAEEKECFVTSVDTIYLLEQLVVPYSRFSVEEKNRIRRNLEGFRPMTVSKSKANSEEFFKIIMGFGNPKPRNIEKDVKVFPWRILEPALKKIIGKYSASNSSNVPASQMLTPAPVSTYPTLPTPPAPATMTSDPVNAYPLTQQSHQIHHHDSFASPRTIGSNHNNHSWHPPPPYSAGLPPPSARNLSPGLTAGSPRQPPARVTAPLPGVSTYDTRPIQAASGSYGSSGMHHASSLAQPHHQQHAPPARWDPSGAMPSLHTVTAASYPEPYQPLPAHHAPPQQHQVYSAGGYGDGGPRP